MQVNQGTLLAGQCTETAAQQVVAMMIACSLLAEERLAIAEASPDKAVRQCRGDPHQLGSVPGIHGDAVHGAAGFAGALWRELLKPNWSDECVCPDRRGGPATRRSRICQRKVRRPVDK